MQTSQPFIFIFIFTLILTLGSKQDAQSTINQTPPIRPQHVHTSEPRTFPFSGKRYLLHVLRRTFPAAGYADDACDC